MAKARQNEALQKLISAQNSLIAFNDEREASRANTSTAEKTGLWTRSYADSRSLQVQFRNTSGRQ